MLTKDCLSLGCLHFFRDLSFLFWSSGPYKDTYFCMAFIIRCTVGFWWISFFPFQTLPLIAQSQSELEGREGNVLSCHSKFAFVGKEAVLKGTKMKLFSQCCIENAFPPKMILFFYYRFITLEYSSFLPVWDSWNHQVTTPFCIKRLSGVVSVVVLLLSRENCPLSGVCSVGAGWVSMLR